MTDKTYHQIRNLIDDEFSLVARRLNLENGDITPLQEDALDKSVRTIASVMDEWIEQNK